MSECACSCNPSCGCECHKPIPWLPPEDVERLKAISLTMEQGTPGEPDTGEDYAAECRALRAILARLEAHRG